MQPETENSKISVIMTALNEESNILPAINSTLKAFNDFHIDGELLVVNDGSSDATDEIIKGTAAAEPRVKIITHQHPQGVGASFWEGVDKAEGGVVTWIPGDNENDPWEIFRYYRLLEHVDMVIPFIFNREARTLFRNILSHLYRIIINTTFFVSFNYTNGTVLYRKSLLKEIGYRSYGFFFQTDILIRTTKKGYLFAEVPYRLGMRPSGISKAVSFPSFLKVIYGYLRLIRDTYFSRDIKSDTGGLSKDSQSAKRRLSL